MTQQSAFVMRGAPPVLNRQQPKRQRETQQSHTPIDDAGGQTAPTPHPIPMCRVYRRQMTARAGANDTRAHVSLRRVFI